MYRYSAMCLSSQERHLQPQIWLAQLGHEKNVRTQNELESKSEKKIRTVLKCKLIGPTFSWNTCWTVSSYRRAGCLGHHLFLHLPHCAGPDVFSRLWALMLAFCSADLFVLNFPHSYLLKTIECFLSIKTYYVQNDSPPDSFLT